MEFDEAKESLKKGYTDAGLEIIDEHPEELFFKYRNMRFRITKEDITEYANSAQFRSTLEVAPVDCGICCPVYREQMLQSIDRIRPFIGPRDRVFVFGNPDDDSLYLEVGQASKSFINFFRLDKTFLQLNLERWSLPYRSVYRSSEISDIREHLYTPVTIRVYNISETSTKAALAHSSVIIESCLFELSYLKHIHYRLAEEWPIRERRLHGAERFVFGEPTRGYQLSLPTASFNSDIISFYQLGMTSDIPILQFLAFYQVLEYFYVTVSDEQLYNKLSRQLKDPKFNTAPYYLDRLIQEVLEHRRITDETEMLKNVLSKFIDEAELIKFIHAYEDYLGEKLYTKKRDVFGEEVEVKLAPGHVIGNVAKIIKAVRNALVHSSDFYGRNARHVPFSKSTEIVKREIPLVKFLAERIIIASAT
jgi:hypothetical protein